MSRIWFVVPPLTGHVNPTVSVGRTLAARGHDVAWAAHPGTVARLLPADARIIAMPELIEPDHAAAVAAKARATRGAAALKFLWEDFLVPLARSMVPALLAAVDAERPDLLVVDQQALAGGLVARLRGLPWASFATTSAGLTDPLAGLPEVKRWLAELFAGLEGEVGVAPAGPGGELSPHRVVAFTTAALMGPDVRFPDHVRLVGPSVSDRPEPTPFPWPALAPRPRPRVLVTMGTVNVDAATRFYQAAVAALAELPVQGIVVAPPERLPALPPNVLCQAYVPQLALLREVDAVVCHGGHNTVCEALAQGLPLVVAPIKDDQPIVAEQVVAAGAGVRVKFGRVQPPELAAAIARVLDDASYRTAAATIARSFTAAGGAAAAATALEELVA
ncbi:MAG: glycosyltransferase [Kofleriaceae bacterium]